MHPLRFFRQLLLITGTAVLLLALTAKCFPATEPYLLPAFAATALYTMLCIACWVLGRQALANPNKNAFTGVILIFITTKMLGSLLLLLVLHRFWQPLNKIFLPAFFMVYLIYTIFGVMFLTRMGKQNPANNTTHERGQAI